MRKELRLLTVLLVTLTLCGCSGDKSGRYDKAVKIFASGDYAEAAAAFEKLGDYANAGTYAAYARGLTLYEQGFYIEAEPYFEKTRGFMYAENRYQYCHAYAQEMAGQYSEAAEGYFALADFEDAAPRYHYCKACCEELEGNSAAALYDYEAAGDCSNAPERLDSLRTQVYDYATQLKNDGQYTRALDYFSLLGDYYDSADQAIDCKNFEREHRYQAADALEYAGDLMGAYNAFSGLSGYNDAQARADALAVKLGIRQDGAEEPTAE